MSNQKAALRVEHLNLSFGGIVAVQDLSFEIKEDELLGLIGPNGAGKTTVFNIISGFYRPDSGYIYLGDKVLNNLKPHKINHLGLARTFQNIRLFGKLSVLDNVLIANQQTRKLSWLKSLFRTASYLKQEGELKKECLDLLALFNLDKYQGEKAQNLPYGLQRKLEIVRALATHPKLLILDEPAAGMNHAETEELKKLIVFIKEKFKLTILLIEHDMKFVMSTCDRIVVLNRGLKIAEGIPSEIKSNPLVIEAYLGKTKHE